MTITVDPNLLRGARAAFERRIAVLSRTALEGSPEVAAFQALGDSILANEGDVHTINMFCDVAIKAIDFALAALVPHPTPSGDSQASLPVGAAGPFSELLGGPLEDREKSADYDWVLVPREPTEAMLKAGMDDLGWWVEPYEAPRESGVPIDNDMSAEDAARINAMQIEVVASAFDAMLAAAPALPRNTEAAQPQRTDAASMQQSEKPGPEATFRSRMAETVENSSSTAKVKGE